MFAITLLQSRPYLLYSLRGATTVEALLDLADRIHADTSGNPASVLLDCDSLTGGVSTVALFRVAEYFAARLRQVHLAAINAPAHWNRNDFCEDVIHNRQGELRHFPTREAAEAWLVSVARGHPVG